MEGWAEKLIGNDSTEDKEISTQKTSWTDKLFSDDMDQASELRSKYESQAAAWAASTKIGDDYARESADKSAAAFGAELRGLGLGGDFVEKQKEEIYKHTYDTIRQHNMAKAIEIARPVENRASIGRTLAATPFLKMGYKLGENKAIEDAMERMQNNKGTENDYMVMAALAAREEREANKSGVAKFAGNLIDLAGTATEFITAAKFVPGLAGPAGGATAYARALSALRAGVGTTAVLSPNVVIGAQERRISGETPGVVASLAKEALSQTITNTAFAGTGAFGSQAGRSWLNSTVRGIGTVEGDKLLQGVIGLQPESPLSRLVTAENAQERGHAAQELLNDAGSMAILEGVFHAHGKIKSRGGYKLTGQDAFREFVQQYRNLSPSYKENVRQNTGMMDRAVDQFRGRQEKYVSKAESAEQATMYELERRNEEFWENRYQEQKKQAMEGAEKDLGKPFKIDEPGKEAESSQEAFDNILEELTKKPVDLESLPKLPDPNAGKPIGSINDLVEFTFGGNLSVLRKDMLTKHIESLPEASQKKAFDQAKEAFLKGKHIHIPKTPEEVDTKGLRIAEEGPYEVQDVLPISRPEVEKPKIGKKQGSRLYEPAPEKIKLYDPDKKPFREEAEPSKVEIKEEVKEPVKEESALKIAETKKEREPYKEFGQTPSEKSVLRSLEDSVGEYLDSHRDIVVNKVKNDLKGKGINATDAQIESAINRLKELGHLKSEEFSKKDLDGLKVEVDESKRMLEKLKKEYSEKPSSRKETAIDDLERSISKYENILKSGEGTYYSRTEESFNDQYPVKEETPPSKKAVEKNAKIPPEKEVANPEAAKPAKEKPPEKTPEKPVEPKKKKKLKKEPTTEQEKVNARTRLEGESAWKYAQRLLNVSDTPINETDLRQAGFSSIEAKNSINRLVKEGLAQKDGLNVKKKGKEYKQDDSILFAPEGGDKQEGYGGGVTTPYTIINFIKDAFGLPIYTTRKGSKLAYNKEGGGTTLPAEKANDARNILHELAHQESLTRKIDLDPNKLPADIVKGFEEFDYVKNRGNKAVSMQEGFAEWLTKRANSDLGNLSPAQIKAAAYAEAMLRASKGGEEIMSKMDRIKDMFTDMNSRAPAEKFSDLFSPVQEKRTFRERMVAKAKEYGDTLWRQLLDSLRPVKKAEDAVEAKKGKIAIGEKLSQVMATSKIMKSARTKYFMENEVIGIDSTGNQVKLSDGINKITEGFSEQEIDTAWKYGQARQMVDDAGKGMKINPDNLTNAKAYLSEFHKNQQVAKLQPLSNRISEWFNSTLRAMEMNGFLKKDYVDKQIKEKPFFLPTTKIQDVDWHAPSDNPFKPRTGSSAEQIIDFKEAVQRRAEFLAHVESKQLTFQAAERLSKMPGAEEFISPGFVNDAGVKENWSKESRYATFTGKVDGEARHLRVNDKGLFQVLNETTQAGWIKTLGDAFEKFGKWTATPLMRAAHTVWNPAWQAKNMFFRDLLQFNMNTQKSLGFVQDTKDFYKWSFGAYNFFLKALKEGGANNVKPTSEMERYLKLFEQVTGRSTTAGGEVIDGRRQIEVMQGPMAFLKRMTDLLGAPEKSARAYEFKKILDAEGITDQMLQSEGQRAIPMPLLIHALDISSQVTHSVHIRGELVEQVNRGVPFIGAHMSGAYKSVESAVNRPEKLGIVAAILATAKLAEWAMNKDDPEYAELPDHARSGHNFKTPVGWIHFPAPRNIAGYINTFYDVSLRGISNNNPKAASAIHHQATELLMTPIPPAIKVGMLDIPSNRDTFGRPITPDRIADKISVMERFTTPEGISYAAGQLAGPMAGAAAKATLGVQGAEKDLERQFNPLKADQEPRNSLFDFRAKYKEMEAEFAAKATKEKRMGKNAVPSKDLVYARSRHGVLSELEKVYHLTATTPEKKAEIRKKQIELAKEAIGKLK